MLNNALMLVGYSCTRKENQFFVIINLIFKLIMELMYGFASSIEWQYIEPKT